MADEQQLKLIMAGVEGWNKWRNENPNLEIDLSRANLSKFDLSKVNLFSANLSGAILNKANLSGTNLFYANLSEAKLSDVDLTGAYLSRANLANAILFSTNFSKADLSGANFSGSNLFRAKFIGSNLFSSNFSKSNLSEANFTDANLSEAKLTEANLSRAVLVHAKLVKVRLSRANLDKANLTDANLSEAKVTGAILSRAILINTNLSGADLSGANFSRADLSKCILFKANLYGANLTNANLTGSDLTQCNLTRAILIETNFDKAILDECHIYGISAWGLKGEPQKQSNLIITSSDEAAITVDNLQVAQFVYLLINRENLRFVLDTITSKAVLILGRFTIERKAILEALANELRKHNLIPIIFDFEKPTNRDFTETVKTLAGMSLFIIADITNPKSSPLELQAIVPDFQVPLVSIIQAGEEPFSMFNDLINKYNWVLKPYKYSSIDNLLQAFKKKVLDRAWEKHLKLQKIKAKDLKTKSMDNILKPK